MKFFALFAISFGTLTSFANPPSSTCSFIWNPTKLELEVNPDLEQELIKILDAKDWSLNDSNAKIQASLDVPAPSCYDLRRAARCTWGGDYICQSGPIHIRSETKKLDGLYSEHVKNLSYGCATGSNVKEVAEQVRKNFDSLIVSNKAQTIKFVLPTCEDASGDINFRDRNGLFKIDRLYLAALKKERYFSDSALFIELLKNPNIDLSNLKRFKANLLFLTPLVKNNFDYKSDKYIEFLQADPRFKDLVDPNGINPETGESVFSADLAWDDISALLNKFSFSKETLLLKNSKGFPLCNYVVSSKDDFAKVAAMDGITEECRVQNQIKSDWKKNQKEYTLPVTPSKSDFYEGMYRGQGHLYHPSTKTMAIFSDIGEIALFDLTDLSQIKTKFYFKLMSGVVIRIWFTKAGDLLFSTAEPGNIGHYCSLNFLDLKTGSASVLVRDRCGRSFLDDTPTHLETFQMGDGSSQKALKYYGLLSGPKESPYKIETDQPLDIYCIERNCLFVDSFSQSNTTEFFTGSIFNRRTVLSINPDARKVDFGFFAGDRLEHLRNPLVKDKVLVGVAYENINSSKRQQYIWYNIRHESFEIKPDKNQPMMGTSLVMNIKTYDHFPNTYYTEFKFHETNSKFCHFPSAVSVQNVIGYSESTKELLTVNGGTITSAPCL